MTAVSDLIVEDLLPHSGKMVLLDRIIDYDDNSLTAELIVRGDGLLGSEYSVPAWAGIEYMAQAIGVYAGIMAKRRQEPIKLGFLLGTRRYTGNVAEFAVGSTLNVSVDKILQDNELGVFDCRIWGAGVDVNARLTVYQPPLNELTFKNE